MEHQTDEESSEVLSNIVSDLNSEYGIADESRSILKRFQIHEEMGRNGDRSPTNESSTEAMAKNSQVRRIFSFLDQEVDHKMMTWKTSSNYRQKYKKIWESCPELEGLFLSLFLNHYH